MLSNDSKIINMIVSILAFIICYPLVFIFIGSFMSPTELGKNIESVIFDIENNFPTWSFLPKFPTLKSYIETLFDQPEFLTTFWNSIKIAVGVVVGQLVIGVPAAWGFARYVFPLKKLLFSLYIILMMLPFQTIMLSEYLVLNTFGLIDNLGAVILPGVFSTFPVFIMYNFFCRIPNGVIEAARLDGANEFQIFTKIGIPLGMPGIIAAMILQFLEYWNVVEQPMLFFENKSLWTLSLYLPSIEYENINVIFAASLISIIPSLLIFSAGQKHLQSGIAATAVKE